MDKTGCMAKAKCGGSCDAEIWGSEPGWGRRASTQGSGSQQLWSMATRRKTDQTTVGVNVDRLLTTGEESYKYGKATLRMNLVILDWNEDVGITSTFRIYRNIEKIQMRMCLYV